MLNWIRWIGRSVFALVVLGLLVCGVVIFIFSKWEKRREAELLAGSRVVSTAAGDVEVALTGEGPDVLVLHGAPGGYDQGLLIGGSLVTGGYRVIAPSRPGYLRTPLTSGLLFENQADTMVELLDALGVKQVAVVGFSAGAQVALELAKRHPERVRGLVLISPETKPYQPNPNDKTPGLLAEEALYKTTGNMGVWLLAREAERHPKDALDVVLAADTTLDATQRERVANGVLRNEEQVKFFRGLIGGLGWLSARESGTRNDLLMLRNLLPPKAGEIQAPVLAVMGAEDRGAEWMDMSVIKSAAPNTTQYTVEEAGHLVWLSPQADAMNLAIASFLGGLPPGP